MPVPLALMFAGTRVALPPAAPLGLMGCRAWDTTAQTPITGWAPPSATDARWIQQPAGSGSGSGPPLCVTIDVPGLQKLGPPNTNTTIGADLHLMPCANFTPVPPAAASAAHDPQGLLPAN